MDLELNGKVAVVTGASKGIGLAAVRILAAEGAEWTRARARLRAILPAPGRICPRPDHTSWGWTERIGDLDCPFAGRRL